MKKLLIILSVILITGCAGKHKHHQGCYAKYTEGFKDGRWLGYQVGLLEGEQNCSEKK